MNIEGLDIQEISNLLKHYVTDYFTNCKLMGLDGGMFAEGYQLDFTELSHLIPPEYHSLYKDTDLFNDASGFLSFESISDKYKESEFTVMLISDENYTKALFLFLQEENNTDGIRNILLADFLKHETGQLP